MAPLLTYLFHVTCHAPSQRLLLIFVFIFTLNFALMAPLKKRKSMYCLFRKDKKLAQARLFLIAKIAEDRSAGMSVVKKITKINN